MRLFQLGLAAGLLAAAPAFAQAPEGAVVSRTATASAVVESIDRSTRQLVLRGEDGTFETVVAGPNVRNLAQVHPGDTVVLEFGEALIVALANPADGAGPGGAGVAGARTAPGQRPGAGAAEGVRARVTVDAVNRRTGAVTFTGPAGVRRTARPRQPEMVEFARSLRPGQQVDIVYGRSVALRVEPMRR
ncbi:hypothetical protein EJV46_22150 [Roseococcus sp. SYP-B2431]|uniref:hypothetical protein n=1 Tax=Roseococcus sp. SYP-B2431 TaxID=2496640 RepID=UPI00103BD7B0|nr:hypothetical protein [Roseococcus sp. SYP-B2431]TCH95982.1 hypothetical protein EJV46_22150 [Roseococcus sp. SYP-B2431]